MGKENEGTPSGTKGNGGDGSPGDKTLTITQVDLDRRIQSETDRRVQQALDGHKDTEADKDQKIADLETQLSDTGKSQQELVVAQKERIRELTTELKDTKKTVAGFGSTFDGFFAAQIKNLGETAQGKFDAVCPEQLDAQGKISLLGKLVAQGFFAKQLIKPEGEGNDDGGDGDDDNEGEDVGNDEGQPAEGEEGVTKIPRRSNEGAGGGIAGKEGLDRAAARRSTETPEEGAQDPWAIKDQ